MPSSTPVAGGGGNPRKNFSPSVLPVCVHSFPRLKTSGTGVDNFCGFLLCPRSPPLSDNPPFDRLRTGSIPLIRGARGVHLLRHPAAERQLRVSLALFISMTQEHSRRDRARLGLLLVYPKEVVLSLPIVGYSVATLRTPLTSILRHSIITNHRGLTFSWPTSRRQVP